MRVGGDVRAPVAISRSAPRYPEVARKARIEGTVLVEAIIDQAGNVVGARVLNDIGMGCGQAALDAIRKRYAAGLLLGEVRKPEGNSTVTLGNALSRYAETGFISVTAGKGRDRVVRRGPQFGELSGVERRLAAYLRQTS